MATTNQPRGGMTIKRALVSLAVAIAADCTGPAMAQACTRQEST